MTIASEQHQQLNPCKQKPGSDNEPVTARIDGIWPVASVPVVSRPIFRGASVVAPTKHKQQKIVKIAFFDTSAKILKPTKPKKFPKEKNFEPMNFVQLKLFDNRRLSTKLSS